MAFEDRETALKFLVQIADQVKRSLDTLQDEIVDSVRKTAHSAWEKRMAELASFMEAQNLQNYNEISQALCAEVILKLKQKSHEDIADSLAQLVGAKVQGQKQPSRIRLLFQNPFKARQMASGQLASEEALKLYRKGEKAKALGSADRKLAEHLTEITPLEEHTHSPSEGTFQPTRNSGPDQAGLSIQDAEILHTEGVNYLGYLIRAPVLATAARCPVTSKVWPFLQAPKGILKSEKSFNVRLGFVLERYQEYVLTGWHSIVASDSRTSLEGAITLSSCIARKTMEDVISSHLKMLEEVERTVGPRMISTDEATVILMQADLTAAYAAIDNLLKRLAVQREKAIRWSEQ